VYDAREVTAVVPVRNGADLLPGCLTPLRRSGVGAVVVVDGLSIDGSPGIAAAHGASVLSDEGKGLPHARALGAAAARTRWVLLVDCDVVFPPGALDDLLAEFVDHGYAALQAGLCSVGGPGYWGRALAHHHRTGRSRRWFGLVATLFERDELLRIGFDDSFASGEDIELRWRLRQAGRPIGVSEHVTVEHRFAGDDFAFAVDQFLMDGEGLGRMVRKYGPRGLHLLALPLAAAVRGTALCLAAGQLRWIPYYAAFCWFNYVGMVRGLSRRC
jgi:glycosyltransferase involved in cell wall biosynthesis